MQDYAKKFARKGAQQNSTPVQAETNGIPNSALQEVFAGRKHATSEMMGHSQNLAPSIAAKMSRAFGMDLMGMQVYQSDAMKGTGMRGMAQGNKVVLSSDVNLNTTAGQAILGHEISHIHAQSQGIGMGNNGLYENAALEHQADTEGLLAAQGRSIYSDGAMDMGIGMSYGLGMQGVEGLTPLGGGMSANAGAPMQADEEKNGPLGWIKGLFSGKKKEPEEGLIAVEQNANPISSGNGGGSINLNLSPGNSGLMNAGPENIAPTTPKNTKKGKSQLKTTGENGEIAKGYEDKASDFNSNLHIVDNSHVTEKTMQVQVNQSTQSLNGGSSVTKKEFFEEMDRRGGIFTGNVQENRDIMKKYAGAFGLEYTGDEVVVHETMRNAYEEYKKTKGQGGGVDRQTQISEATLTLARGILNDIEKTAERGSMSTVVNTLDRNARTVKRYKSAPPDSELGQIYAKILAFYQNYGMTDLLS